MLVIWIGLLFGSLLKICSCETNEISWSTQKTEPDLEEKVNVSNNSIQNSGVRNLQTGELDSLLHPEVGFKSVSNSSDEHNMLVRRDIDRVNGYSSFGENQHSNFVPYQFETKGDHFEDQIGYEGGGILQEDLKDSELDENNEGERLTAGFAPFYQPAGRGYLAALGHKVSKFFGGGESADYYEKPFGSQNSYSVQRHEENLNNELTFRDIVEGNQASVRKDVNSPESDLNTNFQEKRSSNENDYNDVDDSWLMSSMASDQSIVDDVQSSKVFGNGGEDFANDKNAKESMYNDENNSLNDRRLRHIQQTEKSEELLVDAQGITEGLQEDINTFNAENSESILQKSGSLMENLYLNPSTQENDLLNGDDTFKESLLTPQGNYDGGSTSLGNNNKREVNILEDDEKSEIVASDLKLDESSLEDCKITVDFHSGQNTSVENSQDVIAVKELSSNDETLNEKGVSGGNLDLESEPTKKHKRNGKHRLRKKMHSQILNTSQDVLPLKMEDSLSDQSPPISSIDNGGGILLKDLDFQNENKITDTNEDKNSKPLLSQSSPISINDIRNKDKNLVLNEEGPKLPLDDNSTIKSSVETVANFSSFNTENEAKLSQDSSGESIMESIDGVKTLKLSSVNFKSDDLNESNLSSDQSSADKKPMKKQESHCTASRHPIKLSHKNKHKKLNSSKGRIVSSYNRNGLLKTTTSYPATTLDSKENDVLYNSKLFIHEKDTPSKSKQSSNTIKKGFKGKEEKLDGFYNYDTTTKVKRVHKIKKNYNKHKSGIANTKMVKVKLSVSPCQFNKDKYLINNKSASKANAPKILSSRSVKQDRKQLNTTVEANRLNATTSKMLSEGKLDATTQKILKQEKLNAMDSSKGKNRANDLLNPNFFDKTTIPSTSTLQPSNGGQKLSQTNGDKNLETKTTTLASVPQKEIKDVPSTTTRKSGWFPMNSRSARKHSKSGRIPGKKHDSSSLDEDDACDGNKQDDNDDEEYSDSCEKTTKSVCKTTKSECSTTESTESDEDVCDPLEDEDDDNETDGPCEPTEDACETTKAASGNTRKICETTEAACGSTEAPCETTEACVTTEAPCGSTEPPCVTTEAPCETTSPCVTTEAPCETTVAPCETTEAPCATTENVCETTEVPCETTEAPCETTEAPCETTVAPCETTEAPCETTEAPCETTETPCETTENPCTTPCMSSQPPSETTKAACEADEEIETDPPCKTTKICKTASKKGNSTSEANNEYVQGNGDEEDDDDEYDYETE